MRTILLIARAYLFSRGSHSVVNAISVVSLVSLLLPVAAVIMLLSIFNGFGSLVESLNGASQSDLTVRLKRGVLFNMDQIDVKALSQIDGVEQLSFVTEQTLMVERDGRSVVATIRGVDSTYRNVVDIDSFVGVGAFERGGDGWVVLSGAMPSQLGINNLGDADIKLYAMRTGRLQSMMPMAGYNSVDGVVRGVAYVDEEHDQRYGYASQRMINGLLGREGVATTLMIKIDSDRENAVRTALELNLDEQFEVLTRRELNAAIFEVVRYEKYAIMVIAMLVMVLAAFTLMGAETMLIVERRRDISTLAVLGLTCSAQRSIFVAWGAIVGLIAIIVGLTLGLGLALVQQHFELLMLPITSSVAFAYPVEVQAGDIIYVVALSSSVVLVLSYLVARVLIGGDRNL